MTMNDKDIKRHLEAVSRIEVDSEKVKFDLEQVRNVLDEQYNKESKPGAKKIFTLGGLVKYAAMLTIAATFGLVAHYGLPIDGASIAWADVVEKFRSVDNFSAILYMREKVNEEPQQFEIWMGKGNKGRIRVGSQVLFGESGKVIAGFDYVTGKKLSQEDFDMKGERLLEMLGAEGRFSLDTIVKSMCGKPGLKDVTPLVNADAAISEDLVVFDIQSTVSPEWARIWTLKNSLLPVRMRMFDPRGYEQMDLVITYSKPQSDEFFDADSYEKAISGNDNKGKTNRAYALLKDIGGQASTPKDLFDKTNYHMPILEEVGITKNGAVWVIATKSRNRKPDGYVFDGYRKLKDDLGREYVKLWSSHAVHGDRSTEVFVPKDYPFDDSVPSKLILPCEVEEYDYHIKPETIGVEEVTEWQQDTAWPANRLDRSEFAIMLTMADKYCSNKDFDKCEKIIEMISDAGEYDKYEYYIAQLRLLMLMKKEQYKEAAELAMELWAVTMGKYKNPGKARPSIHSFNEYIVAVAASGDIDKAVDLWKEVKNTKPDMSHFSKPARKHFTEAIERTLKEPRSLTIQLSRYTTAEKISRIVGFDVTKHEEFKHHRFQTEAQINEIRNIKEQMQKLSEYYNTHPLPDRMEMIERASKEKLYLYKVSNDLPGRDGYKVWPINYPLKGVASNYRIYQNFVPHDIGEVVYSENLPAGFSEDDIYADVIYKEDVKPLERYKFVLDSFGYKITKSDGPVRKVLVAKYDGRKLKNFKDVTGEPEGDVRGKPGAIGGMSSNGFPISSHFESLAYTQNRDLGPNDEKVIIVNETGIDGPVSLISRHWPGEEGLRLAKEWLAEEFGVTFVEEERAISVWEVRVK